MLRTWGDGIWTHEMAHRIFGFEMGARMTVVRNDTGELAIIAPIAIDSPTREELLGIGPVRFLIAPNLMHYRYLGEARRLFPEATVLAAPGLREKLPELPIDAVLGPPEIERRLGLAQHWVQGMPMFGDVAFFHQRTRTLIVTDLFANFVTCDHWWTRQYLKLGKAYGKPAQTLLLKASVRDRKALRASRDAILQWDFDRIILAHGNVIERGGKDALRAALG